jgi:hypothetical protein
MADFYSEARVMCQMVSDPEIQEKVCKSIFPTQPPPPLDMTAFCSTFPSTSTDLGKYMWYKGCKDVVSMSVCQIPPSRVTERIDALNMMNIVDKNVQDAFLALCNETAAPASPAPQPASPAPQPASPAPQPTGSAPLPDVESPDVESAM